MYHNSISTSDNKSNSDSPNDDDSTSVCNNNRDSNCNRIPIGNILGPTWVTGQQLN